MSRVNKALKRYILAEKQKLFVTFVLILRWNKDKCHKINKKSSYHPCISLKTKYLTLFIILDLLLVYRSIIYRFIFETLVEVYLK